MAVRGVIFDVSDTLITKSDQAVAGAVDAIERLRQQKVQIIAASNNPVTKQGLRNRGIVADHVITQAMVNNKPKGGRIWIDRIQSESGLSTNQLLYVGDTKYDMITASRGPVIYLHAEWASPRE